MFVATLCCIRFFFFNETSTTEIYTYVHTLSLHDALPIFSAGARRFSCILDFFIIGAAASTLSRSPNSLISFAAVLGPIPGTPGTLSTVSPISASTRSEEHTSELQSLMRISYAVFCLKKKIQKKRKIQNPSTSAIHKKNKTIETNNNQN